jgi:hypothetical protein
MAGGYGLRNRGLFDAATNADVPGVLETVGNLPGLRGLTYEAAGNLRVRLENLHGVRWDDTSGGVRAPAPQFFLRGYISCDSIIEGEINHSCRHGSGPHYIKVCIVKRDNDPFVFAELAKRAGPKPT